MKIVVMGGSGLIGKKLVSRLHEGGHEAVAASPSSGVNTVSGAGLADVLVGVAFGLIDQCCVRTRGEITKETAGGPLDLPHVS